MNHDGESGWRLLADVSTTMVYTHVVDQERAGALSPAGHIDL
jgi:hypothetical protein